MLARRAALLAELDARTGGEVMDPSGVVRPVQWWLRDATGMSSGAATRAVAVARGLAVLPSVLTRPARARCGWTGRRCWR